MAAYLLVESRDPFESRGVADFLTFAEGLSRQGNRVTLFLVQNGVLAARHGADAAPLAALAGNGVTVLADSFSLAERGISANRLLPGIASAELDLVVDRLAEGCKAIWH